MFLAALSLMAAPVYDMPKAITNIHKIYCDAADGYKYQGTGFFIKNDVMVTAYHVVRDGRKCVDSWTGMTLIPYKTDKKHDFALLSGSYGEKPVKYSCSRPRVGRTYTSYGYSSDYPGGDFFAPLYWEKPVVATDVMSVLIPGLWNLMPMRKYDKPIMSGMSGGPVADSKGTVIAINNAGNDKTTSLFDLADTGLCTGKFD